MARRVARPDGARGGGLRLAPAVFQVLAGLALLAGLVPLAGWLVLDEPTPVAPGAPSASRTIDALPGERATRDDARHLAREAAPHLLPAALPERGLTVRVVDAAGAPVGGARVALRPAGGGVVQGLTSDDVGRCTFPAPGDPPLELMAVAEGYLVSGPRRLEAVPADELTMALVRGAEVPLRVEREDGAPLGPEVTVEVLAADARYLAPSDPLRPDDRGELTVRGLPPGPGSAVTARAPGCASARLELPELPVPAGTAPFRLTLRPLRLDVTLDVRGAAPTGDLALELRGPAAGGAGAQRVPFTGSTIAVPLAAEGQGWARLVQTGASSAWECFSVDAERPHAALLLALTGEAPLGGFVCDLEGEPLPAVAIEARDAVGDVHTTRTGEDGRFQLTVQAGEEYVVEARRPGATPARARCRAPEDLLVLVLTPTAPLTARPFLGPGGQPLRGVVTFDPGDPDPHSELEPLAPIEVPLDERGHLDLQALPAGRWTISLREPAADELRGWVLEAEAAPGEPLELGLPPDASERHVLRGRLRGGPAEGFVQVDLRPAAAPEEAFAFAAARPADPDGAFAFPAVPPGRYVVRAVWDGGHAAPVEVTVPDRDYVELLGAD